MEITSSKPKFNRRQKGIKATSYVTKVAVLIAIAYVLYTFARFPIFPKPFDSLEMDFSAIPSLLGGFALGPVACLLIEAGKVGLKILTQGSNSGYIGDLSNFIVSLSFVIPATIAYRIKKTRKTAIIGLLIGTVCNVIVACISNYFLIIPLYAKLFSLDFLMDIRALFAFGYGFAFNVIKSAVNGLVVILLYKKLSRLLHFGSDGNLKIKKNNETMNDIITKSSTETIALARKIGSKLSGGEVILMDGNLGAGKTTFTKGIAEALGISDTIQSPTFTIIKEYNGIKLKLYHIDMYRLTEEDELEELGLSETFSSDAVTVIEWNKLKALPTQKIIKIHIENKDNDIREIKIEGLE